MVTRTIVVPNGDKRPVLDHGYVQFIDLMGSDQSIIEAARQSTDKGFLGWGDVTVPGDEKLLKYLYENKHSTPFEFGSMVVEIQAPIFVFREWHRHRTQSYSELSARYTPLPDVNYIPTVERLLLGSDGKNKQAGTIKDAEVLNEESAVFYQNMLKTQYDSAQKLYEYALKRGVAKELARVFLPVGRYSRMRATANLRNWLGFLTLRMAPNAQWEIRQYANLVGELIAEAFPRTWELFRLEAP
jgi:thymidylate synthase (FAD)